MNHLRVWPEAARSPSVPMPASGSSIPDAFAIAPTPFSRINTGVEFVFLHGKSVVDREACLGNLVGTVITRSDRDAAAAKVDAASPGTSN